MQQSKHGGQKWEEGGEIKHTHRNILFISHLNKLHPLCSLQWNDHTFLTALWSYVPYSTMVICSLQHYGHMFPTALWSYVPYSTMGSYVPYRTMVICSLQHYGHMFPTALWSYVPYSTMVICSLQHYGHMFPTALWSYAVLGTEDLPTAPAVMLSVSEGEHNVALHAAVHCLIPQPMLH